MNYRVIWHPDAFRRLRHFWIAAKQPESGIRAFDEIERIPQKDAEQCGESRPDGRRILIVPPIGVLFRTVAETNEALILDDDSEAALATRWDVRR